MDMDRRSKELEIDEARETTHDEIMALVDENKVAIAELRREVAELTEILKPVAEFYGLMRSDIDTLGRLGRALRGLLAWGAAIIISAGVLVTWAKSGFKIPGG